MSGEYHQEFLKLLDKSQEAVLFAAGWLCRKGFSVTLPAVSKAPVREQWKKHSDAGDLYISGKGLHNERVEVKRLSVIFTVDHWCFGSRFIVCSRRVFDNSIPKPFVHIIFSADLRCAGLVETSSRDKWYSETIEAPRFNEVKEYYLAPLDCVKFMDVTVS